MTADHYFSEKPQTESREKKITSRLRGKELTFTTASGVFSKHKVDKGTKVLLEAFRYEEGQEILDLGCGYGAVGVTIAKECPTCKVVMTDINQRATTLAGKNSESNKVETEIRTGDGLETINENELFDHILINPPQTAGRKTCNKLIEDAKEHLKKGGSIWVVARHNKGGRQFEKFLEEKYGNVATEEKSGGYRVYRSERKD